MKKLVVVCALVGIFCAVLLPGSRYYTVTIPIRDRQYNDVAPASQEGNQSIDDALLRLKTLMSTNVTYAVTQTPIIESRFVRWWQRKPSAQTVSVAFVHIPIAYRLDLGVGVFYLQEPIHLDNWSNLTLQGSTENSTLIAQRGGIALDNVTNSTLSNLLIINAEEYGISINSTEGK